MKKFEGYNSDKINILSLGTGTCSIEKDLAGKKSNINIFAIDNNYNGGKFEFGEDLKGENYKNLFLVEGDYVKGDIFEIIQNSNLKFDLVLLNFPYNDEIALSCVEENRNNLKNVLGNIINSLKSGGEFIMTSERSDIFNLKKAISDLRVSPYYRVGENFDFTGIVDEILCELEEENDEIENILETNNGEQKDKIFINGEEIFIDYKKSPAFNFASDSVKSISCKKK